MNIDQAISKAIKEQNATLAKQIGTLLSKRFSLSYSEVRAWFQQMYLLSNKSFDKLMGRK